MTLGEYQGADSCGGTQRRTSECSCPVIVIAGGEKLPAGGGVSSCKLLTFDMHGHKSRLAPGLAGLPVLPTGVSPFYACRSQLSSRLELAVSWRSLAAGGAKFAGYEPQSLHQPDA